jgi:hypothetical protein
MEEMRLADRITEYLSRRQRGREKAAPRWFLHRHLLIFFPVLSDRKMRRAYAQIERVGYCSKGLYWITDEKDLDEYRQQQKSRAISLFARAKKSELALEDSKQGHIKL